jgi:hypothetical protein
LLGSRIYWGCDAARGVRHAAIIMVMENAARSHAVIDMPKIARRLES